MSCQGVPRAFGEQQSLLLWMTVLDFYHLGVFNWKLWLLQRVWMWSWLYLIVWWLRVALWCQYTWIQFLFHFGRGRATSFICTWGLVCCPQTRKLKSLILSSLYTCSWLYVKYLYSQYLQRFFQNCSKEGKWKVRFLNGRMQSSYKAVVLNFVNDFSYQ